MQIPQEYPQFENEKSLLVIAGWKAGKLYFAYDGVVELEEELEGHKHEYTDKEGRFEKRTSSEKGTIHSGAPKEEKKQHIRKEFLKSFMELIKEKVKEKEVESLYIFSPAEGLPGIEKALPANLKDHVKSFYKGNFLNIDIKNVLQDIKDEEEPKGVEVMSEEARKILESTESTQ